MIDIKESYRTARDAMGEGKLVNEDIGDWLAKKAMDKRKDFVKSHMDNGLFNPMKNAMKSIMRGNYQDAVTKMQRYDIKINSAAPTGIKIFGKRYEKIPFGIAAVAYPISSRKENSAAKRIASASTIIREMFRGELQNEMSLKVVECHKYQDILSFVLSNGGTDVKGVMDSETEAAIMQSLNDLMTEGWNPGNINQSMPGFVEYLMRRDAYEVVKMLGDNHKLTVTPNMISMYDIGKDTKLYGYITQNGPHKFALHEPEVVRNDSGEIQPASSGGSFTQLMASLGYDISNKVTQPIKLNNLWVLQEQLGLIVKNYTNSGEKITNASEINIFAGSTFVQCKNEVKKIIAEYKKLVTSIEWKKLDAEGKNARIQLFIQRFENCINGLTTSVNKCLTACGLPNITIQFNTDTSGGLDPAKFTKIMQELGVAAGLEKGTPKKTTPRNAAPTPTPAPTPAPTPTPSPSPSPTPAPAPAPSTAPTSAPTP